MTLINYLLVGVTLAPFCTVLLGSMLYFGAVQQAKVVLNPRGWLALPARLFSALRQFLPKMTEDRARERYERLEARYFASIEAYSSSVAASPIFGSVRFVLQIGEGIDDVGLFRFLCGVGVRYTSAAASHTTDALLACRLSIKLLFCFQNGGPEWRLAADPDLLCGSDLWAIHLLGCVCFCRESDME